MDMRAVLNLAISYKFPCFGIARSFVLKQCFVFRKALLVDAKNN